MPTEAMTRWNPWMPRRCSIFGPQAPDGKNARGGLYTANRIAAQLFKTALEGRLAEDQFVFKKQARLLNAYIKTETQQEGIRAIKNKPCGLEPAVSSYLLFGITTARVALSSFLADEELPLVSCNIYYFAF